MNINDFVTYDPITGLITPKDPKKPVERVRRFKSGLYKAIYVNGVDYLSHRLAFFIMTGRMPDYHVDHINGNGLDNSWSNLRVVSQQENALNKKIYSCNSTGFAGVTKRGKRYRARIRYNGVLYNLGTYDTPEEAGEARKNKEMEFGFHRNHGRKQSLTE